MMKRPKISDKLHLSGEDANDHSGVNDLTGNSMLLYEPNDENQSAYFGQFTIPEKDDGRTAIEEEKKEVSKTEEHKDGEWKFRWKSEEGSEEERKEDEEDEDSEQEEDEFAVLSRKLYEYGITPEEIEIKWLALFANKEMKDEILEASSYVEY